jgi:hypothetical protein
MKMRYFIAPTGGILEQTVNEWLKKEAVAWPDASSGPATCEMKIRGDGTGVEIKQRLGK